MSRSYVAVPDDVFPTTWQVRNGRARRRVTVPDFATALALVVAIGAAAEEHDHHPDIWFGWGYLEISCHTHATGGLTDADLALVTAVERILAARW